MMQEKEIRKYAQMMRELDLTGLQITQGDQSVRLERTCTTAAAVVQEAPSTNDVQIPQAEQEVLAQVASPMVGVFYSAPAENAKPFVQLGDHVKKGDVLCVIEAMKLMSEITSDYDGTIAEICVGNRQEVDYGHVLFRIREDAV